MELATLLLFCGLFQSIHCQLDVKYSSGLLFEVDDEFLLYEEAYMFPVALPGHLPLKKPIITYCAKDDKSCKLLDVLHDTVGSIREFQRAAAGNEPSTNPRPVKELTLPQDMFESLQYKNTFDGQDPSSHLFQILQSSSTRFTFGSSPSLVESHVNNLHTSTSTRSRKTRVAWIPLIVKAVASGVASKATHFGIAKVSSLIESKKNLKNQVSKVPEKLKILERMLSVQARTITNQQQCYARLTNLTDSTLQISGEEYGKAQSAYNSTERQFINTMLQLTTLTSLIIKIRETSFRKVQEVKCDQNQLPSGWFGEEMWSAIIEKKKQVLSEKFQLVPETAQEFTRFRLFQCDGYTMYTAFGIKEQDHVYSVAHIQPLAFMDEHKGFCKMDIPTGRVIIDFSKQAVYSFKEGNENCLDDGLCQIPKNGQVDDAQARCLFQILQDNIAPDCTYTCEPDRHNFLIFDAAKNSYSIVNMGNMIVSMKNGGIQNVNTDVLSGLIRITLDCHTTFLLDALNGTFSGDAAACENIPSTEIVTVFPQHEIIPNKESLSVLEVEYMQRFTNSSSLWNMTVDFFKADWKRHEQSYPLVTLVIFFFTISVMFYRQIKFYFRMKDINRNIEMIRCYWRGGLNLEIGPPMQEESSE